MMTSLLKGRHNMMTLRLKRCVSLFVCLSLLVSACSPGKSSKANSKANKLARNTKVEKNSVKKIADYVPSAVDNNNVTPVGFWNRELGKVGGFSVTPTVVGTVVAILGTIVLYIGYKRYKQLTQQPSTVPPPKLSLDQSVKEANAIDQSVEEANAIKKAITA
jgi:hypothetical protein